MKPKIENPEGIKNIIVFALPGIGDALLFTPALPIVKRHFPNAHIYFLVMMKGAYDIVRHNPYIDELVYFNFMKEGAFRSLKFVLSLRRKHFDLAITAYPANRLEYNGINFLVGARIRPVHRYRHLDFVNASWLNHPILVEDNSIHNVEENLRVLELLGCNTEDSGPLEIYLTEDELNFAKRYITENGLSGKPLVGFHPGTATLKNQARRRWAPEKFAELARRLTRNQDVRVLVFGGPEEKELKQFIASEAGDGTMPVTTETVLEAAALIAKCSIFVSGDSGLMHIAAAMQTPIVAIFGPTHPEWVHPYRSPYIIIRRELPCSPCFYYSPRPLTCRSGLNFECVRSITVDEVEQAVAKLL